MIGGWWQLQHASRLLASDLRVRNPDKIDGWMNQQRSLHQYSSMSTGSRNDEMGWALPA